MLEILTTVILSIMAIASPPLPYDYHSYTAKAKTNSLASSVLEVKIVPETPPTIAYTEKEGEKLADFPEILNRIAFCESGGKHFDGKGQVIRGKENPNDIGKWQINIFYHWETANKLGYDIFTEEGNEKYALWLYQKNETKDWRASQKCWGVIDL